MKFSEKYTGYICASFMIPDHELDTFQILLTPLKNDLYSKSTVV